jgi:hypothetical protein
VVATLWAVACSWLAVKMKDWKRKREMVVERQNPTDYRVLNRVEGPLELKTVIGQIFAVSRHVFLVLLGLRN